MSTTVGTIMIPTMRIPIIMEEVAGEGIWALVMAIPDSEWALAMALHITEAGVAIMIPGIVPDGDMAVTTAVTTAAGVAVTTAAGVAATAAVTGVAIMMATTMVTTLPMYMENWIQDLTMAIPAAG